MRKSTGLFLVGAELGLLSWWFLALRYETGVDALQYNRMTVAIVTNGLAPWILSPLSYVGIYPGSDSSGVPFLNAMFSMQSQITPGVAVLVYDSVLFVVFTLGLFIVSLAFSHKPAVGFLAMIMGGTAFGFATALSWSFDERSFNVALLPIFLLLVIPVEASGTHRLGWRRITILFLISLAMFVSHLSYLLLIPFVLLVPPLYRVVVSQSRARVKRASSAIYFATVGASPFLLLSIMNALGIMTTFGLDYSLSSSALFSGSSPLIFVLNSAVFLATRAGPIAFLSASMGFVYFATRRNLDRASVALGALFVAGFIGLPVVVYSKDLLTPMLSVMGSLGLVGWISRVRRHQLLVLAVTVVLVGAGSIAFDTWNQARNVRSAEATLWTPAGVPPEAQDTNLWIVQQLPSPGCLYGNNGVAVEQVALSPTLVLCLGGPIDYMLLSGSKMVTRPAPIQVVFSGFNTANPSDWFASAQLDNFAQDFLRLQNMDFESGRAILATWGIHTIVVALEKPTQVPLYGYEGTRSSMFFLSLWDSAYPIYRSTHFAVFAV